MSKTNTKYFTSIEDLLMFSFPVHIYSKLVLGFWL